MRTRISLRLWDLTVVTDALLRELRMPRELSILEVVRHRKIHFYRTTSDTCYSLATATFAMGYGKPLLST